MGLKVIVNYFKQLKFWAGGAVYLGLILFHYLVYRRIMIAFLFATFSLACIVVAWWIINETRKRYRAKNLTWIVYGFFSVLAVIGLTLGFVMALLSIFN